MKDGLARLYGLRGILKHILTYKLSYSIYVCKRILTRPIIRNTITLTRYPRISLESTFRADPKIFLSWTDLEIFKTHNDAESFDSGEF